MNKGAALAGLGELGLEDTFELMEGPGHEMLPRLLAEGRQFDFAFIDGWHTFDYTLVDAFYIDKMLRPGGIMTVHDMHMPSKRKVWGYLSGHRRYRKLRGPVRPLVRRILGLGWALAHLRGRRVLRELRELSGFTNTLVVEKLEDWEPSYKHFRDF